MAQAATWSRLSQPVALLSGDRQKCRSGTKFHPLIISAAIRSYRVVFLKYGNLRDPNLSQVQLKSLHVAESLGEDDSHARGRLASSSARPGDGDGVA